MPRAADYYDDHPISETEALAAIAARGGAARVTVEQLFEFDQDHYGGLAAVDALAQRARIRAGSRVLDVCAGLAGPARFLATRRGCCVVAVELHPGRAAGAARLTARTGLASRVHVVRADACALPFAPRSFDACISQEGLLHIDDKAAVLAGCHRVLVAGGRLAFTDWVAHPRLGDVERAKLAEWMAATTLETLAGYRRRLGAAGFAAIEAEDLTDEWRAIVGSRLATFRALRAHYVARLGERRYDEYERLTRFFVTLIEDGKLGGGRFTATA